MNYTLVVNLIYIAVAVLFVMGLKMLSSPAAAQIDKESPIYGMPIINVDEARTVFVLKRSMATGFAGVQNRLFFNENTRMLFGDAKGSISSIVAEFKEGGNQAFFSSTESLRFNESRIE